MDKKCLQNEIIMAQNVGMWAREWGKVDQRPIGGPRCEEGGSKAIQWTKMKFAFKRWAPPLILAKVGHVLSPPHLELHFLPNFSHPLHEEI